MSKFNSEAWRYRQNAKIPFPIRVSEIKWLLRTEHSLLNEAVESLKWDLVLRMVENARSLREFSIQKKLGQ